ncbi:MAG: DUF4271 domain-containing protein [Bacteroidota bacterium]
MLQTHTLFILIVGILISWPRLSKAQADDMRQTDLVLMDGQWQWQVEEDRQSISLPFIDTKARRCTLDYRFCVPDSIGPDSLFLLFEGMAWESEVLLDESYIGLLRDPFVATQLAISPDLLGRGEMQAIRIVLHKAEGKTWYPEPFVGMMNPPRLMTRRQLRQYYRQFETKVSRGDTVAIVAPYYRSSGYCYSAFEAMRNLQPVYDAGIEYVYFPFPPSGELLALCERLELKVVREIVDTTQIALINTYPFAERYFPTQAHFWLDEEAYRTSFYGDVRTLDNRFRSQLDSRNYPLGIVLMLLFPILSLFLLKILNPGYLASQLNFLFNPKMHLGVSLDATGSNTGLLGIMMILKGINLSIIISMLIYYIMREHEWECLNIIRDWSLLSQWFYGRESLWQIFVRSLQLVAIWFGIKYSFLALLGRGYGIKGLVEGVMNLEVAASFPLILFMGLPVGLVLYKDTIWGGWLAALLLLLGLLYLIRRLYVFFIGLDRLFSFSSAVNFLYICALNLIPYLIWL